MKNLKALAIGLLLALASPVAAFAQCSGNAPASTYCGNPTVSQALPGWKPISGVVSPSPLTKSDDTNVTLTLTGTPATALLQSVQIAAGWTGTLASGRLNSNVVQGIANDTNVTGSIAAQNLTLGWTGTLAATRGGSGFGSYTLGDILYASGPTALAKLAGNITAVKQYLSQTGTGTVSAAPAWATISGSDITGDALTKTDDTNVTLTLGGAPATALLRAASLTMGWTGTLAAARLNSNVVQGVTNDTNVTGSIAAQALTLGWTGTLAITRGGWGASTASDGLENFNIRHKLTGTLTLTVNASTGNDATCLSNLGATACQTFQGADTLLKQKYDLNGKTVLVSAAAAGAYASFQITGPYVGDSICGVSYIGAPSVTITNATNATPIVVTASGHAYANGDHVVISGVGGNTAANGAFIVASANIGAGTFALTKEVDASNVAGTGAYTSGGTVANPRSYTIADTTIGAISGQNAGTCFNARGFHTSSTVNNNIFAISGATININGKMSYGANCGNNCAHVYASRPGSNITITDAYAIQAGGDDHLLASHYGAIRKSGANGLAYFTANVTFSGTGNSAIAFGDSGEIIETGFTTGYFLQGFSAGASVQYLATEGAILQANGNYPPAAGFYPGSNVGTVYQKAVGAGGPGFFMQDTYWFVAGGTTGYCITNQARSSNNLCFTDAGAMSLRTSAYAAGFAVVDGSGNVTSSPTATVQQTIAQGSFYVKITGVNFNSANTDNTVTITLPTGFTRYRVSSIFISHASATITTATCGVFTATGAGGTAIVASGSAITVSTASESTNNNMMALGLVNSNTSSFTTTPIYFRVQTAQGSAATADVTLILQPIS